jgi:hypothetical protein
MEDEEMKFNPEIQSDIDTSYLHTQDLKKDDINFYSAVKKFSSFTPRTIQVKPYNLIQTYMGSEPQIDDYSYRLERRYTPQTKKQFEKMKEEFLKIGEKMTSTNYKIIYYLWLNKLMLFSDEEEKLRIFIRSLINKTAEEYYLYDDVSEIPVTVSELLHSLVMMLEVGNKLKEVLLTYPKNKYNQILYRGLILENKEDFYKMNGIKLGDNLPTKTFTSTSVSSDVAEGFTNKTDPNKAFMLKITVPPNTFPFPYISNCKTPENCEAEVLLPFGCLLKFEKEEKIGDIHNICYKLVEIDKDSKIDIHNIRKIILSELEKYSIQKYSLVLKSDTDEEMSKSDTDEEVSKLNEYSQIYKKPTKSKKKRMKPKNSSMSNSGVTTRSMSNSGVTTRSMSNRLKSQITKHNKYRNEEINKKRKPPKSNGGSKKRKNTRRRKY